MFKGSEVHVSALEDPGLEGAQMFRIEMFTVKIAQNGQR